MGKSRALAHEIARKTQVADHDLPQEMKSRKESNSLRLMTFSRGDWRSFEPLIAAYVDAALSPNAEVVVATRVMRLSA